jgi:hypothetical protein
MTAEDCTHVLKCPPEFGNQSRRDFANDVIAGCDLVKDERLYPARLVVHRQSEVLKSKHLNRGQRSFLLLRAAQGAKFINNLLNISLFIVLLRQTDLTSAMELTVDSLQPVPEKPQGTLRSRSGSHDAQPDLPGEPDPRGN